MEIQILSQENGMAQVRVTLPGSALTSKLDEAYSNHQSDENFTLPREGLDSNPDGRQILWEAVQELFSGVYQDIMKQIALPAASEPKVSVVRASETSGAEFRLSFALRPEMKLGRYKGIRVKMPDITPTDAEYEAAVSAAQAANIQKVEKEGPAASGDTTVIDYTGYQGGEAFAGGAGTDHPLTLGSGAFIPGFEEQLIGASAGDRVEVAVTFPENYRSKELAGKPAVFQVTVKQVLENQKVPLTDAQKSQARAQAEQDKKNRADQQIEDEVLGIILEEAHVDLPDAMVESEANVCLQQFAAEIAAKNMTIDQFCQQTGKTIDGMRKEMEPLARRRIQLRMVLSAIADAEGITAEEEELEQAWAQMSQQYGMPREQLLQYAETDLDAELRAEIVSQKAYNFLRESTILEH